MKILKKISALRNRSPEKKLPDPVVNINCTEFEVNNWIVSEFIVNRLVPIVGVHPFPLNELQLMVAAVCRIQPTHIFEWGTHIGKSARIFYETAKSFSIKSEIHSTDLPTDINHVEHPKDERGSMVKGIKEVSLHTGDGLIKSMEIYNSLSVKNKVLFYLDGDHSYTSVYNELKSITDNIPEAHILLHDTFNQSSESGYNIGPYKAMQDILQTLPGRYSMISTLTGLPGMTFLYKI